MISDYILSAAHFLVKVYFYAMILYVLSSWIPPLRHSRLMEFVGSLVEPYLGAFRRFIPPIGMLDFSPIVAILVYQYLMNFALIGLQTILDMIF